MELVGGIFIMEKFKTERNDYGYMSSKSTIRQDGMRDQLDWIKRQLEYYAFAEKYNLRYDLKQGEIYEFDWGINVNAEFSNRHYGVVLADSDIFNPLVTVCPLKTNHGGAHPKSDVDLGFVAELNSTKSTLAVVNQIRTLDKLRMYTRRAIGLCDGRNKHDPNDYDKMIVMRLENSKLNMIKQAYIKYLSGEETE